MVDEEPIEIEPISLDAGNAEPMPLPIEEEPIQLLDPQTAVRRIQTFGAGRGGLGTTADHKFKRPVNLTGAGATRCKIFHTKIAVAPMEYMEGQINSWLDANEIEVKSVTQVVGVLEGKTAEPNLIVMVWY